MEGCGVGETGAVRQSGSGGGMTGNTRVSLLATTTAVSHLTSAGIRNYWPASQSQQRFNVEMYAMGYANRLFIIDYLWTASTQSLWDLKYEPQMQQFKYKSNIEVWLGGMLFLA